MSVSLQFSASQYPICTTKIMRLNEMMAIKCSLSFLETFLGTHCLNSEEDKVKRTRTNVFFYTLVKINQEPGWGKWLTVQWSHISCQNALDNTCLLDYMLAVYWIAYSVPRLSCPQARLLVTAEPTEWVLRSPQDSPEFSSRRAHPKPIWHKLD